jgi:hypothetical protein
MTERISCRQGPELVYRSLILAGGKVRQSILINNPRRSDRRQLGEHTGTVGIWRWTQFRANCVLANSLLMAQKTAQLRDNTLNDFLIGQRGVHCGWLVNSPFTKPISYTRKRPNATLIRPEAMRNPPLSRENRLFA